jgi:putative ABC transport system permease protein
VSRALPGFGPTLRALLGHWRRRPTQAVALLVGLALATALWSGVQGLNAQARDSYARAAAMLGGAETVAYARPEGGPFDERLFAVLRRAGWPVSPVVEGRVLVGARVLSVIGVDPISLPPGAALAGGGGAPGAGAGAPGESALGDGGQGDGAAAAALALLADPQPVLAAPSTLVELGLEAGEAAPIAGVERAPPILKRDGVAPATLVADIGLAQKLTGLEGRLSRLIAPAGWAGDPAALARLTDGVLAPVGAATDATELAGLTESFHLNLTAFGFLAFAVGLFIVHSAVGLAFEQRRPLVRTLRACGVPARTLGAALLAELGGLALLAGAAGMLLGYGVAAALLPDVAATLRGIYGAPVDGRLALAPAWWLAGLGMALLGALAAAAGKLHTAWRMRPLESGRPEAWMAAHRRAMRGQAAAAAALLCLAMALGWSGESLVAGFALLAALLLGAALALPPVLSAALARLAPLAQGPLLRWALADARQALSGLSLALMALLLALAANIGVGAMVGSFRDAFTGWLDQRLAADLYVRVVDDAQAEAFEALARRTEGARALLPSRDVEVRVEGWPVDLEGLVDDPVYRDNWPFLAAAPDVWERMAAGEGALVSEQLARKLDVGLGDRLTVPAAQGAWPLTVSGVYPDYGNPKGQIVVNFAAHAARWPEAARGAYGVATEPEARAGVLATLRADPAMAGAELADQATIKAFSLRVFERTFAVTGALNALTLGVAGVALLAALTTLSEMRLAQVAPLWAMGAPRRRLALLELARMAGLAALTAALAIPLGVALAWALVAVVNVQAFGWRLPLAHFPADWARLGLLAVAVALLAAALPAWRLARTPPARLAAVFAQER